MAIKDIKFMNREGYLLKELSLSLSDCETQIKQIDYESFYKAYRNCKDENGVEKTQFPSIIFAFYSVVFSKHIIPTPSELLDEYYMSNSDVLFVNGKSIVYQNQCFKKSDLDARILRTYPSLVRDYHFFLMLVEEQCFDKVIYSCKNDISGKDVIIQHHGKEFILSLFVKTKRSNFFKKIKNTFRHNYGNNEIQMPLNLNAARKCGDFYVYGSDDVIRVKSKIL